MPLQPEHALAILQMTLPSLEREQQTTVKVMEAVPADKADYKPDPNAMSAFDLCWHIAASEDRFLSGIAAGAFDFSPKERVKTLPEVLDWYQQTFARNLTAIKGMTGEQLVKIIDFRGMFQLPAISFLTFSSNHSIHHRGQLSVYLRPMGAKVPAIYGESYDSKAARMASQG
jgi:uncharacterized damage-inducible protein DinB